MPYTERTYRSQASRIAAFEQHAQGKTNTAPAREAFLARFEREVDPDGVLEPAERARRAAHARKAYFTRLALKSARARRRGGSDARGVTVPLSPSTVERVRLAYPPQEAASLLGISRARLYQLIADGTIPSVKIGRSRRICADALADYLERLEADQSDGAA